MPRRVESERDILRQREEQWQQQHEEVGQPLEAASEGTSRSPAAHGNSGTAIVHSNPPPGLSTGCEISAEHDESVGPVSNSNDTSVCSPPTPHQSVQRKRKVHIAVQGCCHGELDKIYAQLREHESASGERVDFLLCCGDFQSVRNEQDMQSMAVPDKYKTYGDFVKYHRGEKRPPVLTLFVGGNHEASNLLAEQYYGGYVSEGIYYLGHSSVVRVCGVRIGSLSGIYKGRDYTRPYPTVPYQPQSMREAYHVRSFEVEKLHRFAAMTTTPTGAQQCTAPPSPSPHAVDIMLSHDWPVGITKYGDEIGLLKIKPYFADDIAHSALGNPHTMDLLKALRPRYWFAAHLHCHFTASVPHVVFRPGSRLPSLVCPPTDFIALDKCVHHSRKCLTYFTIEVDAEENSPEAPSRDFPSVVLDSTWVSLVRQTHGLIRTTARGSGAATWEKSVGQLGSLSSVDADNVVMESTSKLLEDLRLGGNPLVQSGTQSAPRAAPISYSGAAFTKVAVPSHQGRINPPMALAGNTFLGQELSDDCCSWVEDAVGH